MSQSGPMPPNPPHNGAALRGPPVLDQPVLDSARSFARDRYLSALLSPAAARGDLIALAAYLGEIERIPLVADDPAIGEIRLQWWRDALVAPKPSGNPVADAVQALRARQGFSEALLMAPIEGVSRQLYEDGITDASALALYAEETDGAALRMALAILGAPDGSDPDLVEPASRALALTRIGLTLPQHLAHGRMPVPPAFLGDAQDPRGAAPDEARRATRALLAQLAADASSAVDTFRSAAGTMDRGLFAAFLPMSLVQPYFNVMLAPKRDVLREIADISPLSRVLRLWFAHWRRKA